MTDPTDRGSAEPVETETLPAVLSRRALLGVVVAMWSAGSISDIQALRLLYGTQGYGWFGYGGTDPGTEEE
jgi:hypothetical protein